VMKPEHQYVFSFPMRSPVNAVVADSLSGIEQLEIWKAYQTHWTEHKVSMTVYVGETEWMEVGAWVYKNFDMMSGVAFLPRQGHSYQQAPYEEITEEQYLKMVEELPKDVDWAKLGAYEMDDSAIEVYKELACTGDKCELSI